MTVVLFAVLALLALARLRAGDAGTDLASYKQAAWHVRSGRSPFLTIPGAHLTALNGALAFYPIALLTRFFPLAHTLLVVQSAALALGVLPLWKIVRQVVPLRVGTAAAVVAAYCIYPPVQNLNLADFHPVALALPALMAALQFGIQGRLVRFGLCAAWVVACRADLSLAIVGVGVLLALRGNRRVGAVTAAAGAVWLALALTVEALGSGAGGLVYPNAYAAYGDQGPASVIVALFRDPSSVIGVALNERNFGVAVFLLAPLAFLPFLSIRHVAPILPLHFFYIVGDIPDDVVRSQLTVAVIPFLFLATAEALSRLGRLGVERVAINSRIIGALLLAAGVFFVRDAASSPYREPWDWGSRTPAARARAAASTLVEDEWAVRASPKALPGLAERTRLYGFAKASEPDPQVSAADDVVAIIIDEELVPDWSLLDWSEYGKGLEFFSFVPEPVFNDAGVRLYLRSDVTAQPAPGDIDPG